MELAENTTPDRGANAEEGMPDVNTERCTQDYAPDASTEQFDTGVLNFAQVQAILQLVSMYGY